MRERVVELTLATLFIISLGTEALSAVHALGFGGVVCLWIGIAVLWGWGLRKLRPSFTWDWYAGLLSIAVLAIWLTEGLTALVSPPNSSDAMAYHMPRVVYWIQQRSVEFFATPYLNQIMLQPLHEYVTLHLQLLSGEDRFANCVAWLSTGGYIVGASLLARSLGAPGRGQALAAFLAATLSNGILQASGAKNEALLSFLLVSMVYFALAKDKWRTALACGLACFTKGTAYLFCAPLMLLMLPTAAPHFGLAMILIQGPFLVRNIDLSGSPLGFDSAHADGRYRWRNESLGWRATASNVIRHSSEQLGSGNQSWNYGVYETALSLHRLLGLDANDPQSTWPQEKFGAPKKASHETDANNRWHLAVFLVAVAWLLYQRDRRILLLLAGLAAGALMFCFYLKWQPFMSRMWLPVFVVSMGVAAVAWHRTRLPVQLALCVLLLDSSRLPLLKGWIRPLLGNDTMFQHTREELYFNDMKTWNFKAQYDAVLTQLRRSSCRDIGMDINRFQLEYPLQALMLREFPETRFVHINTDNPSRKYEARMANIKPCITVCLACESWIH